MEFAIVPQLHPQITFKHCPGRPLRSDEHAGSPDSEPSHTAPSGLGLGLRGSDHLVASPHSDQAKGMRPLIEALLFHAPSDRLPTISELTALPKQFSSKFAASDPIECDRAAHTCPELGHPGSHIPEAMGIAFLPLVCINVAMPVALPLDVAQFICTPRSFAPPQAQISLRAVNVGPWLRCSSLMVIAPPLTLWPR